MVSEGVGVTGRRDRGVILRLSAVYAPTRSKLISENLFQSFF